MTQQHETKNPYKGLYFGLSKDYDRVVSDYTTLQEQYEMLKRNFHLLATIKSEKMIDGLLTAYGEKTREKGDFEMPLMH